MKCRENMTVDYQITEEENIYIHTLTYIHTYTHTYTYMHTYIHTHVHTYTHTHIHTYTHIHFVGTGSNSDIRRIRLT